MTVLLAPHDGLAGNPVKLNDTAGSGERLVAVPRIIAATKRQQRAFGWRDLENHVFEIVSGAEQPKLTTSRLPPRIHVDQDRNDFGFRVGVNLAVFFAATAPHGDHVGPIRQIDTELFLKRLAEFVAAHLFDEFCKGRSVTDLTKRKAPGPVYFGIIVVYRRAHIRLHKFRNNQEFERLAGQRCGAEPLQIQHRNHGATLHADAKMARWNFVLETAWPRAVSGMLLRGRR